MRLHLEIIVPGVDPIAAARWWSDFQDGHTDHAWMPGQRRTIIERGASHVSVRESMLGLRFEEWTAWPGERAVRFVGRNWFSTFDGTYSFDPAPSGTRLALDAEVKLRRGLGWSEAAARPIVLRILRADLAGHARDLQRDLSSG